MNKLLNLIARRPRQWLVSKSTTIVGVVLLLEATISVVRYLISPADLEVGVLQAKWEEIMQALVAVGLLEAKSNNTRTEDIEATK